MALFPGVATDDPSWSLGAWLAALDDFRATPRDTVDAVRLLLKGRDAPSAPDVIRTSQQHQD